MFFSSGNGFRPWFLCINLKVREDTHMVCVSWKNKIWHWGVVRCCSWRTARHCVIICWLEGFSTVISFHYFGSKLVYTTNVFYLLLTSLVCETIIVILGAILYILQMCWLILTSLACEKFFLLLVNVYVQVNHNHDFWRGMAKSMDFSPRYQNQLMYIFPRSSVYSDSRVPGSSV